VRYDSVRMPVSPNPDQSLILSAFTVLNALRQDWGGALILACGLGVQGTALAFASNIAGGVCLSLEEDAETLKVAMRSGACDFVVNTLDEALRVMKNEIRKRRPLSVGLAGIASALLEEIVGRGVAPEVFASPDRYPEAAARLRRVGALLLSFEDATPVLEGVTAGGVLASFVGSRFWKLHTFEFASSAEVRAFDAGALALLAEDDRLRRHWLLSVARILPRERQRVLWLTDEEKRVLAVDSPTC
jgi:Urocanase Rossmann-like domain